MQIVRKTGLLLCRVMFIFLTFVEFACDEVGCWFKLELLDITTNSVLQEIWIECSVNAAVIDGHVAGLSPVSPLAPVSLAGSGISQ